MLLVKSRMDALAPTNPHQPAKHLLHPSFLLPTLPPLLASPPERKQC